MQELAWVSLGTPPMTVREYLVDHYAACMYRRMRVHGVESGLASALALKARKRLRSGEGGDVPALGVKDERRKLTAGCIYCSGPADSIDHLIPRLLNGPDSADNLVPACKSCNSSKGARDLFEWAERKRFFPLAATRRYLALAWRWWAFGPVCSMRRLRNCACCARPFKPTGCRGIWRSWRPRGLGLPCTHI